MATQTLQCDYLIVGTGAVGMAFADTLLSETDASIVLVDRYAKPGGHWNKAYPFVTLHQPSQFYGVSSEELSSGYRDEVGLNQGLWDLASGAEVSAYFDRVMRHRFLPSGRVQYFPLCEYLGDGSFRSVLTGDEYVVDARRHVDATYLKTTVPSTHKPSFTVAPEARFIPINGLVDVEQTPDDFVVIGGGKTGIDACLWLLQQGVAPEKIRWIVSRDAWLLDRQNTQPSMDFFDSMVGTVARQFEAAAAAESVPDLFNRLEQAGVLLRLDPNVTPQMFHGATVSRAEVDALRQIKNVIRLGHVTAIERDRIVLQQGEIPCSANTLHVDCSASAITNLDIKTVFDGKLITPQTVRPYQPVFSAAFIAHVEAAYEDEAEKNELCSVVPLPNHDTDWIRMLAAQMMNQYRWTQDKSIGKWLLENRLDAGSSMVKAVDKNDAEKVSILNRVREASVPAVTNLMKLIESIDAAEQQSSATA